MPNKIHPFSLQFDQFIATIDLIVECISGVTADVAIAATADCA
jgi:hypothetical protein